jgi:hypothetical protein
MLLRKTAINIRRIVFLGIQAEEIHCEVRLVDRQRYFLSGGCRKVSNESFIFFTFHEATKWE